MLLASHSTTLGGLWPHLNPGSVTSSPLTLTCRERQRNRRTKGRGQTRPFRSRPAAGSHRGTPMVGGGAGPTQAARYSPTCLALEDQVVGSAPGGNARGGDRLVQPGNVGVLLVRKAPTRRGLGSRSIPAPGRARRSPSGRAAGVLPGRPPRRGVGPAFPRRATAWRSPTKRGNKPLMSIFNADLITMKGKYRELVAFRRRKSALRLALVPSSRRHPPLRCSSHQNHQIQKLQKLMSFYEGGHGTLRRDERRKRQVCV